LSGPASQEEFPCRLPGRSPPLLRSDAPLYIVSPVDLLPESALFLLGMTDDVLVAGWVVSAALDAAGEYALWRRLVPATATTAQPSSSRTASTVSASPAALSAR
jgi:hypothetical protein